MTQVQKVQTGDSLTLHFALRVHGNTQNIDSSFAEQPISLTLGDGTLEPNLERCLIGLPAHARKVFTLEPHLAFGEPEPLAIMRMPVEQFTITPVELDQLVEFTLEDGATIAGHIIAIEDNTVCVDFNHILAGKTVEFEVEIISIYSGASNTARNSA